MNKSLVTLLLVTCHSLRLAVALCVGGSLVTLLAEPNEPVAKAIQDNSFFVEEAYNQEAGVVQHILNASGFFTDPEREFSFVFTQEWPIFTQKYQFSYSVPYAVLDNGSSENGIQDIRLNFRFQALFENESTPAFAPRFSFVLPTGDADKGFGHDRLGYEINLPVSKIVSDRVTLHFNAGTTFFPDVRGHDLVNYNLGGSAIYAVSENFNLMLESVAKWEEDVDEMQNVDRTVSALISPGARYAFNLSNDAQLVVGVAVPIGLTSDSPDYGFFLYFSYEHPFVSVAAAGKAK